MDGPRTPVNPMDANPPFWHLGTPEYLLVRAGLFDAHDVTVPVSPTAKLRNYLNTVMWR